MLISARVHRSLQDWELNHLQQQLSGLMTTPRERAMSEFDAEREYVSRDAQTPRVELSIRPRTPRDDAAFAPRLDGSGGLKYGQEDLWELSHSLSAREKMGW